MRSTFNIRSLSALACLACLCACAQPIKVESAPPPPALVQDLPPQPQVPTEATDAAVGQYVVDLRSWGREIAARYDALRAWAVGGK